MKKVLVGALVLVLGALAVFVLLRPNTAGTSEGALPAAAHTLQRPEHAPGPAADSREKPAELTRLEMAEDLNAPGKGIRDDLVTLDGVFLAYQSNFLKEGNPVGTNREITASLTGDNALRLAFIDRAHPAINGQGELCDRWGTPFFFHQLSAGRMEIISAGPDRDRGTADDVSIE